jgi:hypothetical protein
MVADCPVALDHALITKLSLAGVVVEPVVTLAVIDVAVEDATGVVGKEEDVWRLFGRTDPSLTAASVELVQVGPLDRAPGYHVYGHIFYPSVLGQI